MKTVYLEITGKFRFLVWIFEYPVFSMDTGISSSTRFLTHKVSKYDAGATSDWLRLCFPLHLDLALCLKKPAIGWWSGKAQSWKLNIQIVSKSVTFSLTFCCYFSEPVNFSSFLVQWILSIAIWSFPLAESKIKWEKRIWIAFLLKLKYRQSVRYIGSSTLY